MLVRSMFSLLFCGLLLSFAHGQDRLNTTFYDYHVVNLDSKVEMRGAADGFFSTTIAVPNSDYSWDLDLHNSNIIGDDYIVSYHKNGSKVQRQGTSIIPAKGYIVGEPESRVSLTFADGFIYGFIKQGGVYHYIEPLSHYDKSAEYDQYIVYSESDLKPTAEKTCATDMTKHNVHDHGKEAVGNGGGSRSVGECFDVDYAIASDFLMFQDYGSVAAVEAHAIGVTNNVQTNYDDEFGDELTFVITEQFVATSAGSDPWTTSTSAGVLLDDFTDWGPTGFSFTHDIGSLWTARDFSGSTIGIAWVGAVCTNFRYNCLQDFSSNPQLKRVMVAHEIGHNFSASHDGSGGFIMSPSVNNTNTWSSNSITSVDNHVASRWCLSDCAGGGSGNPPVADFTVEQFGDCAVVDVQFTDASTGNNLDYDWSFPGGTPSSSTLANPSVSYFSPGIFNASLTVSNGNGSNSTTQTGVVEVNDVPAPDFNFDVINQTVTFFNNSFDADTYEWNFGDGSFSTDENPVHTYAEDDFYEVTIVAFNDCGSSEFTRLVEVATLPSPAFDYSEPQGCTPHTVQFSNTSTNNSDSFLWSFPGGTPSTSTETNPEVEYEVAGIYDVSLTATNEQGSETITETNIIDIVSSPVASFTFTVDGGTVTFTNTSDGGDNFIWDFGDGNSSTDESPVHTYASQGVYNVVLEASGACTPTIASQEVTISLLPVAAFATTSGVTDGCAPFTVTFVNTSSNDPTSYMWTFEGGTPATSTAEDPTVTFESAGLYDVQLVAQNANGTDTELKEDYVQVQALPTAAPTSAVDELTVVFEANATASQSVSWDFGDGNTSSELNPTHTYTMEGDYEVTLTVSSECGDVTQTIAVSAYEPVTAGFTSDETVTCEGATIVYENMSSTNTSSLLWTFEGGNPATSTAASPAVTYEMAGSYSVSLQVSNPLYDDVVTVDQYVVVQQELNPIATAAADGLAVTYSNTGEDASDYLWDFGDGATSTEASPTHTYAAEGIYTATLTATNSCGSYSSTVEVNLYSQVTAAIMTGIDGGCAPYTISLMDATSDNTTEWLWTFEGGDPAMSTMASPTVTFAEAGTYTISLTASNPASTQTTTIEVDVTDVADVSFDYIREELTILFTNTSVGGDSYAWDFGDGNTSTDENPTHTYETEGDYDVSLEVTNECGVESIINEVAANALPSAGFTTANASTGCLPYTVEFTDASSSNVTEWLWTFEGGEPSTSTEENPVVMYSNEGTYDVSLEVTAAAGTDMTEMLDAIVISDVPTASITNVVTDLTVAFTYDGDDYDSINWDFGNGTTSTDENPTVTYDSPGTYAVTMTVTNACGDRLVMDEVTVMSTSTGTEVALLFDMYPNPAKDQVTIETSIPNVSLALIDITGQLVMTQRLVTTSSTVQTSDLAEGTYILQLRDATGQIAYKKLVVFR